LHQTPTPQHECDKLLCRPLSAALDDFSPSPPLTNPLSLASYKALSHTGQPHSGLSEWWWPPNFSSTLRVPLRAHIGSP